MKGIICAMLMLGIVSSLSGSAEGTKLLPGKKSVCVAQFKPAEGCKLSAEGAKSVTTRIVGNVVSSRKYVVVERDDLEKVLKEKELWDSGMMKDPPSDIETLAAAHYCIYGEILQYSSEVSEFQGYDCAKGTVELLLKSTDIKTGVVKVARKVKRVGKSAYLAGNRPRQSLENDAIMAAVDKASKDIVLALIDFELGFKVVGANDSVITVDVAGDLVTVDDDWEVYAPGRERSDPNMRDSHGRAEKPLGRIRVSAPGDETTEFAAVSSEVGEKISKAFDELQAANANRPSAEERRLTARMVNKPPYQPPKLLDPFGK